MVTFCYYCLCLIYMRHLYSCKNCCFLNFVAVLDLFTLKIIWSVFAILICPSSCSSSLCTACLGPLQTALIWFILPYSQHFLPYPGHFWGRWMDLQYLHRLTCLIWLSYSCKRTVYFLCMYSSLMP